MANLLKRRSMLSAIGGATAAGIAGCFDAGATGDSDGRPSVAASFFVLGDFARQVAGDAATVETLVPVGQHGHGWEPDPRVTQRAVDADAFVYVGEGFQPWADDVVRNVRDGDSETLPIEVRADVDLLDVDGDSDHDEHDEDGHRDAEDHEERDHEDSDHHHVDEHAGEDDHASDDGHGHGWVDPHFWLDPRRAATAVDTVRDGLQRLDDADRDAYADNAATYRESLMRLDATFEETLSDRSRDAVLVAGHDAFRYLAERYGFDVVALTGLSPDDSATTDDVRRAQKAVETHGIRHVLAPVMESDQAARSIVADTDAEAVLPITALPGRDREWTEKEWGYEAVMREVNLPSLQTALGAE